MKTSIVTNKSCFAGDNIGQLITALTAISGYVKAYKTNMKFKLCIETDMQNQSVNQYDDHTIRQTPTGDVRFNLTVDLTKEESS